MEQDRAPALFLHQHELAWRAFVSHEVILELIGATTTRTGLRVHAERDPGEYPTRVKVSDPDYTIAPIPADAV